MSWAQPQHRMFRNRVEAGRRLANMLQTMSLPAPVVLALPRGGVPVAAEVADVLHAPLDLVLVRKIGAPPSHLREIERRRALYLGGRLPLPLEGRTAIVVDDGIATGTTMRAALRAVRSRQPARLVVAAPVAPEEQLAELNALADDVVVPWPARLFGSVGEFYDEFDQTEDAEVVRLMRTRR